MGDVLFYHLTQTPLESTLSNLLEKSLANGWRVRVRGTEPSRLEFLDRHLWTYHDEGFLPHGLATDDHSEAQPILLTTTTENTNNANVLMLIDGAMEPIDSFAPYDRVCIFFDGNDAEAVTNTRTHWKAVKDAGLEAKYWAQENGQWTQKG